MKTVRTSAALLSFFLLAACGDSTGPGDRPLVLQILDTQTEPPARVLVTFQLTDQDGQPVPDVPVGAFEILDNGESDSGFESSKAFQPKPGRFQTSVALLVDMSGSITGSDALASLRTAAEAFVDKALEAPGVAVGVWWFDGETDIVELVAFTDEADSLKAAIQGLSEDITRDNSTNLNGAIQQGIGVVEDRMVEGAASGITQTGALVIFTDGSDQASRVPASEALAAVEASEIAVYSIGLRGEIDESFLTTIGRSGSAFADNSDALLSEFSGVGDQIEAFANSFYVLAYCSPRRAGLANQLTIRADFEGRRGEATTTYAAVNFTGGCTID